MKRSLKKGLVVLFLFAGILFFNSGALADTISGNHVVVESGGVETSYNLDEVKMEMENGKSKACICRMLSFRALQMLASQFPDRVIPKDDIQIYTGWTTDGPEELFVEVMGWAHEDLAFVEGSTDPAYLTIEDAVFFFVQKSTGKAWKISGREGLYPLSFFTYRTWIKTKQATDEQTAIFQTALRPQAVLNMETLPVMDKFDLQAIPFLGADGILRIPVVLVSGGVEYCEVELKKIGKGKGFFQVIKASP